MAVLVGSAFPIDVHAVTTTIHAAFDGRQPEMPARLRRDGSPTTCEMEAFPGVFPTESFWQSFAFCNGGPETCFTATFDEGTCGDDVHIMAHLDPFDPNDLPMNYLGDVGASDSLPFSFVVPAGARFLIVAQTNFGAADCSFGFTVDAMKYPTPAPLFSGFAVALAAGVLGLVAFAAMRRSRHCPCALGTDRRGRRPGRGADRRRADAERGAVVRPRLQRGVQVVRDGALRLGGDGQGPGVHHGMPPRLLGLRANLPAAVR